MNTLKITNPIKGRGKATSAFKQECFQKKLELVNRAISWNGDSSNSQDKLIFNTIWKSTDEIYEVSLGKYGKEFYRSDIRWKDGHKGNNPNDMKPCIFKEGILLEFDGSFDYVFHFFQDVCKINERALQILGSLLFRNAYLLDHDTSLKYNPPTDAIDYITSVFPTYNGIPVEVFLHYLEAVAINEDTKYYTLGYNLREGAGRSNNMLTYTHLIAVLLGKASLAKLCSNFSRPPVGVSPITLEKAKETFPDLEI